MNISLRCHGHMLRRYILIIPTLAVGSLAIGSKASETEFTTKLDQVNELNLPQFKAVGQPPSVLAVHGTPSVPLYIKKGSIMSIYGVQGALLDNISSRLSLFAPIRSFFMGNHNSAYQRVVSTSPFSLLISSTSKKLFGRLAQKTFAVMNLEGTQDWAIINNNAIHAYFGTSLIRRLHLIPRKISKRFAKASGLPLPTNTGLFKWYRPGYTLLSGRGTVALVGGGNIYNVHLEDGEQAVVSKNNLLGLTVNGPHDIQNSVFQYRSNLKLNDLTIAGEKKKINPFESFSHLMLYLQMITVSGFNFLKDSISRSVRYIEGTGDFVVVTGPRDLLLQSGVPQSNLLNRAAPDQFTQSSITPKETTADFLNYVTIDKGKTKIESTPDFRKRQ